MNGPRPGGDTSAVLLDRKRIVVSTIDPISYIPSIGAADSAFLSVHLIASDLTTSSFSPQYGIFDFNLPQTLSNYEFAKYWRAFHSECKDLQISIIGGHTGRYLGSDDTIIGAGALLAVGPAGRYVASNMARPDDNLILTKGAAIETTAVMTRAFPRIVRKTLGTEAFNRARDYLKMVTTVKDALIACSAGRGERGVTAMHDATEGGVLTAAAELAEASQLGVTVDLESVEVSDETSAVCRLFKLNPLYSLSEGSLLIASRPLGCARILRSLFRKGINARVIGQFSNRFRGLRIVNEKEMRRIVRLPRDRYWEAYSQALRKGWA